MKLLEYKITTKEGQKLESKNIYYKKLRSIVEEILKEHIFRK